MPIKTLKGRFGVKTMFKKWATQAIFSVVVFVSGVTYAAPVITYGDHTLPWRCSSNDLLQTNLASTTATGNFNQGYSTAGAAVLNDGQFSWTYWPAFLASWENNASVEYHLNTSVNIYGYDITGIDTYGGWPDSGRDAQQYLIYYSVVGSADWVLFDSVNYNPATPVSASLSRLAWSFNLQNVDAIKLVAPVSVENGWVGLGEIDVIGTPTLAPTTVVHAGEGQNVWLTGGIVDVSLNGTVTSSVPYTVLWSVVSQPAGSTVVFTPAATNTEDLSVRLDRAGTYVLKLTATDGDLNPSVTVTVTVYADACAYAQVQPGFAWMAGDINYDCEVNLEDLLAMTERWLGSEPQNYGQLQMATFGQLQVGFSQPDMIYAPFMFWFWDEPVNTDNYPAKPVNMVREMIKQGINPGYAHPRVSMADYQAAGTMVPSPSLPKEQWLSPAWFNAFDGALQEAEAAKGYFGYCDEYMWPSGRAAGRVMQQHPELGNANLQWKVVDVAGGSPVELPESFFTVAAQIKGDPPVGSIPEMQGVWIWQNAAFTPACNFRKSFTLNAGEVVSNARIMITADNAYVLYVNGTLIGNNGTWMDVETYDVTTRLQAGKNVIAVEGGGDGYDALLFDLKIGLASGQTIRVVSDASWVSNPTGPAGWTTVSFNDASWTPVKVMAPGDSTPWNLAEAKIPYLPTTILSSTLQLIGSGDAFSWTAPVNGSWRIYTFKKIMGGDVNMLDQRLAAAFIDIAYKPYADRFGDRMGKSIPGVFCDTEGSYGSNLPWSDSLTPCYLANTGRDIRLWMPLMLDKDVEGISARARFDWFNTVSDLYTSFFAGINEWLTSKGMYFTGHVWEENLLWQTCTVGDPMKLQRAFSMPGMDSLFKSGYDIHDFKEIQSVSEFEGRRLMSEIMGAAGWNDFNPITVKEIANCVINWGVNHVMPHGIFMSRGLNGNPWLPDWYDRNPMWSNMRLWSDFTRRASYVNSQGHVAPDVLLLNPMDSVWTQMNAEDLWGPNGSGNLTNLGSQLDSMAKHIETVYSDAIRKLAEHRIEYLIGDRHYVNQMSVDGARLVRGEFRFKTVVLPPMVVLPLSVARKIVDFAKSGGYVYTLGELPTGSIDNGLNDPLMTALMSQLQAQPTVKACTQGLVQELDAKSPGLTSPIQFTSGEFPMLQLRRRIDNREFFWLVNNSDQARQCVVQVADAAGAASVWDCETGTIRPAASTQNGSGSQLQLAFQPHEAYWLVFDPQQPARTEPIMALPNEQTLLSIEGTWTVRIDPAVQPNLEYTVAIPTGWTGTGVSHSLTLWETWAEMPAKFSGLLDYTKTVTLPAFTGELVLDLGKVNHFAEVWVNGQHVGAKLWPPHKFPTNAFHAGSNEIRIRVGNLVNNNYNMASPSGLVGPVIVKTMVEE
jgi:hypothetical protein